MMNSTPRRDHAAANSAPDPGHDRDFVTVDDSGDFSYHRSAQDLLAAFEYVAEAACIIDRNGITYRLALDPDRHLTLAPPLGPVEFHWLRQAWLDAQNAHPETHRLRRFFPLSLEEVVSDLFETLPLEHGTPPAPASWSLDMHGRASYPSSLKDIDHQLARQKPLDHIHVADPYGHLYQPARHRSRWHLPTAQSILYIEIPAP